MAGDGVELSNLDVLCTCTGHEGFVWCCAWSPDGKVLATCGTDKTIRLWSLKNENLECTSILTDSHSRTIRRVSWDKSGETIASCSFDGTVCVFIKNKGEFECTVTLEGHENEVKSAEFSPSGRYLATCSRDKTVWIWERTAPDEFECVSVQSVHTQDVKVVKWHPKMDLLASAGYDNSINFYADEGDDWACEYTATGHDSTVWSIDFDATGSRLVSCSDDKTVRIWQYYEKDNDLSISRSWKCVSVIQGFHSRSIYDVSWSKVNGCIATACGDNQLRIFAPEEPGESSCYDVENAPNFQQIAIQEASTQDLNCVQWSPVHSELLATASDNEECKVWKFASNKLSIECSNTDDILGDNA